MAVFKLYSGEGQVVQGITLSSIGYFRNFSDGSVATGAITGRMSDVNCSVNTNSQTEFVSSAA